MGVADAAAAAAVAGAGATTPRTAAVVGAVATTTGPARLPDETYLERLVSSHSGGNNNAVREEVPVPGSTPTAESSTTSLGTVKDGEAAVESFLVEELILNAEVLTALKARSRIVAWEKEHNCKGCFDSESQQALDHCSLRCDRFKVKKARFHLGKEFISDDLFTKLWDVAPLSVDDSLSSLCSRSNGTPRPTASVRTPAASVRLRIQELRAEVFSEQKGKRLFTAQGAREEFSHEAAENGHGTVFALAQLAHALEEKRVEAPASSQILDTQAELRRVPLRAVDSVLSVLLCASAAEALEKLSPCLFDKDLEVLRTANGAMGSRKTPSQGKSIKLRFADTMGMRIWSLTGSKEDLPIQLTSEIVSQYKFNPA